ncbi:nucleoside-diphosphate sugar epimerase [Lysinibacillus sp. 54212]|uniref:nucleoside-diphosphate sugar epimerase n=1 Tax=Lysinibacillus sp. 54212 TaxID=3119829 RepID=UPI002FCBDBDD
MLRLSWMISLGIALLGVMVIQHFFSLSAEERAGGGNLGAVGITLVLPFILLSLFTTFRYFVDKARKAQDKILRALFLIGGIALIGALIYFSLNYKDGVYIELGGTTKDEESKIYGFPVLNEYTNHVFINFYTFALIQTISAVFGGIIGTLKQIKTDEAFQE